MRDGAARDRGQVAAHGRHGALRPHDGAKGAAHREPELLDRARRAAGLAPYNIKLVGNLLLA